LGISSNMRPSKNSSHLTLNFWSSLLVFFSPFIALPGILPQSSLSNQSFDLIFQGKATISVMPNIIVISAKLVGVALCPVPLHWFWLSESLLLICDRIDMIYGRI
ncbi:hypothetical protein PanWU01x14_072670, partial [Parasponia andersonii]